MPTSRWSAWPRRIARNLRTRGIAGTLRLPWREVVFRVRHPELGARPLTTGRAGAAGDGHRDEGSRIALVEQALAMVPPEAHQGAFVDVGCARGRVLQVATAYPFTRIVGIEIDPELAAIARRNLSDARVTIVEVDAGCWVAPTDVRVIYLFNPFGPATLSALLGALAASQDVQPRSVYVVDVNGVQDEVLADAGFEVISREPAVALWVSRADPLRGPR